MEKKSNRDMWVLATDNLQTVKNKKKNPTCWFRKKNTISTGTSPSCGFEEQQRAEMKVHAENKDIVQLWKRLRAGLMALSCPRAGEPFCTEQQMSQECTSELISLSCSKSLKMSVPISQPVLWAPSGSACAIWSQGFVSCLYAQGVDLEED